MLSRFSVKKPYTVVVGVIIVLIMGFMAFTNLSTDLLPSMNLPYAIVMTTYGGASPEEVELTVTKPVESSMATVSNIKHVSSVSSENYSMVICEFNDTANMDSVTIEMRESLDMLKTYWPDAVGNPMIMKLNPDMMPVMVMAVDADGKSMAELSKWVEEDVVPGLESLDGVASVTATGLLEQEIQVVLREDKINALNRQLMDQLESKFAEAEGELSNAKAQLESGKNQLDQQSTAFRQQMLSATAALTDGKIQLMTTEAELEAALLVIQTSEEALGGQETNIQNLENELAAQQQALGTLDAALTQLEELDAALRGIQSSLDMLTSLPEEEKTQDVLDQMTVLEASKAQTEAAINQIADSLSAQGIIVRNEATGEIDTTAARAALKAQQEALASGMENLAAAKVEYESFKTEIADKKAQINAGLAQISAGKSQLSTQESQLNAANAEATTKMNGVRSDLASGENQLNSAQQELEGAQQAAKDNAALDGIITVDMVKGILAAQNFSMPAGYVKEDSVDYLVRVGDKLDTQESLGDLVLFDLSDYDMGSILLKDVADIEMKDNTGEIYAKVNHNDGVLLTVQKQTDYSTADVAKKIREYNSKIETENEGAHLRALMDQGVYIDMVIKSVLNNLIIGAILAIAILLLFLKDIKPTAVIAISIPVSVVFAMALMYFSGVTLNIISLSGLALGVGMLVDNSIVVIENIYRLRGEGMSVAKAAVQGAKQVTGAIIASTLTTICIWTPIIFVEGITKQLFVDLVLTIAYSLLASLVVALTVVPAMSSAVMGHSKDHKHIFFNKMVHVYEKVLSWSLNHKAVVLILVLALLLGSGFGIASRGMEFMGETDSPQISVTLNMEDGTPLEETAKMSDDVIDRILGIDGVDAVGAMTSSGMSMMGGQGSGNTDSVTMYILLNDERSKTSNEIASEIEEVTENMDCEVIASGSTMDMSALGGSGISAMVKGPDIDTLKTISTDLAGILSGVEGTVEVSDGQEDPVPELRIQVDKGKAMLKGLTVAQVYQEISARIKVASQATTLTENNNEIPVIVVSGADEAMVREDIKRYEFTVTKQDGTEEVVALADIANIYEAEGLSSIQRDAQQRYITVSAAIDQEHNASLVARDFQKAIKDYEMPDGYSVEFSGENESTNEAMGQLIKLLALGIIIMYLIMVAQFQSLLSPFIVMFTIPLAFTGGFLGLLVTGNILSVIAMVGFVMLCGIIVNNGIVFIDYTNQMRDQGMEKRKALLETGKSRLRPILMTALTTILAMSTMALGFGEGSDMVQPMAIVTIGGLIYGTLLTLIVVPVIYDLFNRRERRKAADVEK